MSTSVLLQVGGVTILPPCLWLPSDLDPVAVRIVQEAHSCIGVTEHTGSNRGPLVDVWLRMAGVPEAVIRAGNGYWCAAWAGAMWRNAGQDMPVGYADCDVIMRWAQKTRRWSTHVPALGGFVLYGTKDAQGQPADAKHIGIPLQLDPLMSAEGNTTVEGSRFERNGTAVALKLIDQHDPVLGYVHLRPLPLAA